MQSNIIRDRKTGDSLNYAFIEFETQEAAEVAYEKMDNVIIDDRRIKVDFSQSAHHQWRQFNLGRREKQIEKVLLNTNHMYQSIRGIAGNAVQPVQQLELPVDED